MKDMGQQFKEKQYNKILEYVISRNGTLLTSCYESAEQYFKIKCELNHIWDVKFSNIMNHKTWCKECGLNKSLTILISLAKTRSINCNNIFERLCKVCNNVKKIELFQKINGTGRAHTCRDCFNLNRPNKRKQSRFKSLKSFIRNKLAKARSRAKRGGLEFNLTLNYLEKLFERQVGLCAISKEIMTFEVDNIKNISIDRINSNFGYTENNIQLVCDVINFMKLDLTTEEFVSFCKKVAVNN